MHASDMRQMAGHVPGTNSAVSSTTSRNNNILLARTIDLRRVIVECNRIAIVESASLSFPLCFFWQGELCVLSNNSGAVLI